MNFSEHYTAIIFRAAASFVLWNAIQAASLDKKVILLKLQNFIGKHFYINILFRLEFSQENKKKLSIIEIYIRL